MATLSIENHELGLIEQHVMYTRGDLLLARLISSPVIPAVFAQTVMKEIDRSFHQAHMLTEKEKCRFSRFPLLEESERLLPFVEAELEVEGTWAPLLLDSLITKYENSYDFIPDLPISGSELLAAVVSIGVPLSYRRFQNWQTACAQVCHFDRELGINWSGSLKFALNLWRSC